MELIKAFLDCDLDNFTKLLVIVYILGIFGYIFFKLTSYVTYLILDRRNRKRNESLDTDVSFPT